MDNNQETAGRVARMLSCAERLTHSRAFTLLRDLEPAFVVFTVIGVFVAISALRSDLDERERQRIARSWQTIASEAPGNTGKSEALEHLATQGESLNRVDLSPNAIKRNQNQTLLSCNYRVYLPALDLGGAIANGANLSCTDMDADDAAEHASFDQAQMSGATFIRSNTEQASFVGADLAGADFRAAQLGKTNFSKTKLEGTKFDCAILDNANFSEALTAGMSIRHTALNNVVGMNCDMLEQMPGWRTSCRSLNLECDAPTEGPGLCGLEAVHNGICSAELSDQKLTDSSLQLSGRNKIELQREIVFRLDQVDRVVNGDFIIDEGASGEPCTSIYVVSSLGGIVQRPPPKEDETVWIGNSGYGYRHIPFKSGTRSDEFNPDNLLNLVEDYLQCVRPLDESCKTKLTTLREVINEFGVSTEWKDNQILACNSSQVNRAKQAWQAVSKTARTMLDTE